MSPSVSVHLLLTQTDARLVALARDGHERAFEALVRRYRRPLLHHCRRLLLSDERAEDALQQALLQAWVALQRGVEVTDARSWLYRIVYNAGLNALRVSGYDYCKLNESLSGADAPQTDLDRRIAVREALAGLAALPEMQREALMRTAVEGRSHEQVARDLGVSENALRGLVYRARTTLRAAATAITPTPALSWAVSSGARGTPLVERLAEVGAGGGSAGLAGLFLKGSAVMVTAGALATGVGAGHTHRHATAARSSLPGPATTVSSASPVLVAAARSETKARSEGGTPHPVTRHPGRLPRHAGHANGEPASPTAAQPPIGPAAPGRSPGRRRDQSGQSHDGQGSALGASTPGAPGVASEGKDSGAGQSGSGGDVSSGDGHGGDPSGGEPTGSAGSGSSGGDGGGISGGDGGGSSDGVLSKPLTSSMPATEPGGGSDSSSAGASSGASVPQTDK